MAFFTLLAAGVYAATQSAGQPALYLIVTSGGKPDYELNEAVATAGASFAFFDAAAVDAKTAAAFAQFVSDQMPVNQQRMMFWLAPPVIVSGTPPAYTVLARTALNAKGTATTLPLNVPVFGNASLRVASNMTLALSGTTLTFQGPAGSASIAFSGAGVPLSTPVSSASLAFDGLQRGSFAFPMQIYGNSLQQQAAWGFQIAVPPPAGTQWPPRVQWYPLSDPILSPQTIGFSVVLDPCAPTGTRTVLTCTDTYTFVSAYRTTAGWPVSLQTIANASRFVFNPGVLNVVPQLQLAPYGDFTIVLPTAAPETSYELMAGLSPLEHVTVRPKAGSYAGDRLRFTPGCAAYAPSYPFASVSSLDAPIDPGAALLNATYTTSWASVVRAPDASTDAFAYVTLPKGSSLFGRAGVAFQTWDRLYGPDSPKIALPGGGTPPAPLLPYGSIPNSGSFPSADLAAIEAQIVVPTRRKTLEPHVLRNHFATAGSGNATPTTTPSGTIVTRDGDTWTQILLGKNFESGTLLAFDAPPDPLVQAFQTNALFLVIADATNLGPFNNNTITVGNLGATDGWALTANVGANKTASSYDDYTNVTIVKGCPGAIADLVANPRLWTQREAFSQPHGDPAEVQVLSSWLQRYIADAASSGDTNMSTFNDIVTRADWTGTLVLRMDIADPPASLAGITAGIAYPERFRAHHFAVEISPVTNDGKTPPALARTSSMYGLIEYVDPDVLPHDAGTPPAPLPSRNGAPYDFRVLDLTVRFENSAVVEFSSHAQLNLGSMFGLVPLGLETGTYGAVLLQGSFQQTGGLAIYSLTAVPPEGSLFTPLAFGNNVVDQILIAGVQMSTRDAGADGTVVSWFAISGFFDFAILYADDAKTDPFDVFSFGSAAAQSPAAPVGLPFANLGVTLAFPHANPYDVDHHAFTFDPTQISFDVRSNPSRADSLYRGFGLDLQGLVSGDGDNPPSGAGYAAVISDAQLGGVDGSPWYGLKYRIDLGTPGALAGKVGLNAYFVTAWAAGDGSGTPAFIGLQLPGTGGGASLISLQTVLTLSIGQMKLVYAPENAQGKRTFLLMLTEMALKFMGLLSIPPNGSTLLYVFGNPDFDAKPSGLGWYALYKQNAPQQQLTGSV